MSDIDLDTLKHLHLQQREELQYRRSRCYQIFAWTVSILMGLIAALILKQERPAWSGLDKALITGLVLVISGYSAYWQRRQTEVARGQSRVIVKLLQRFHAFDEKADNLCPREWLQWGQAKTLWQDVKKPNKIQMTLILGLVAACAVWWE